MIEIDLHRINNQARLGMFIPEHAEISNADSRHQGANHLVELARRGSQYSSKGGVSHIQKRLYPCFLAGILVFSRIRLFRCQARTRSSTITYQRAESRIAKHAVPSSQRYRSRIRPHNRIGTVVGRNGSSCFKQHSQTFITRKEAASQSREARDPVIFEHAEYSRDTSDT